MIFDGRSIHDITDDEIDSLVKNKVGERQHLEYKVTVKSKEDLDRLELLHDIASLANGGGGYVIVGIRGDENGRAQKYEPISVGDTEAIKKAISSLCQDYISERIEGLEVVTRKVKGNPLVMIRVPASARVPHMVTYQNRTDYYSRYNDGKREMTIGEIREAFNKDIVGLKLAAIEAHLRDIYKSEVEEKKRSQILIEIESGEDPHLLEIDDGGVLYEAAFQLFTNAVGKEPYLWISATPANPKSGLIDVRSPEIFSLIKKPPGSRDNGWNMRNDYAEIERFSLGFRRVKSNTRFLQLLSNGLMEFWTPLDESFCLEQSHEEFMRLPRLFPYCVIEYPVTFMRLYRNLIDLVKIEDELLINLHYRNLKGYILRPYAPGTIGYDFPNPRIKPFPVQQLHVPQLKIDNNFDPEKIAYILFKSVYELFSLDETNIPFFDRELGKFKL